MKIFAYINWVFFLVLFSFFAYEGIDGLDKSYDNNYFEFKIGSTTDQFKLVSLKTVDDGTGVHVNTSLELTFNEDVQLGTGNIVLKLFSDNSVVDSFNVDSLVNVSVNGSTVKVDSIDGLSFETAYYIEVDSGAILSTDGDVFKGISGNSDWNFKTNNPSKNAVTDIITTVSSSSSSFFSDSVKILATLLDSTVVLEHFPFDLFTHIIIDENNHIQTFKNYHERIIRQKERLNLEDLEDINLLLNIELDLAILPDRRNIILKEGYKILDSLKKHFPNTRQGIVFELNATEPKDTLNNRLHRLHRKITSYPKEKTYKDYQHYVCLRFLDLESDEPYEFDFPKNELPNYGGQLIKTFDHREESGDREKSIQLSLFDRMNTLLDTFLTSKNVDVQNTIFCFPTYSLILRKKEKKKDFRWVNLQGSINDPAITKINEEKNIDIYSKKIGQATIDYYKYLKEIRRKKIYRPDTTNFQFTDPVTNQTRDSIKIGKKHIRTDFDTVVNAAFEDKESLESKIEFAIRNGINIGFWNNLSVINQDEAVSKPGNPIKGLLVSAKKSEKGFVKALLKNPEEIVRRKFGQGQNGQSDWTKPDTWYWPTVKKHFKTTKTPDYLLFLLTPLLILKILLPLFIFYYFRFKNPYAGGLYLKPLKVELFFFPTRAYTVLILDVIFWSLLYILFILNWYSKEGIGCTTRNFSILLLLVAALGRPVIKFIIKLSRLIEGKFNLKKAIKLLPYLGEMIYYNLNKEDLEASVKYIKGKDKHKNVFKEVKIVEPKDPDEDKDNPEARRVRDYFSGSKYKEILESQKEESEAPEKEIPDREGRGFMEIHKGLKRFFKSLFVVLSVLLVWHFEFYRFIGWNWPNFSSYYNLVLIIIFIIEIIVIRTYFFKEFYTFYLFKLFARNV